MHIQIQEANRANYLYGKRYFPRHITLKLSKVNDKERILKAIDGGRLEPTREIPLDYDQICSVETLKAGSEWDKIYKILRKTSSEE